MLSEFVLNLKIKSSSFHKCIYVYVFRSKFIWQLLKFLCFRKNIREITSLTSLVPVSDKSFLKNLRPHWLRHFFFSVSFCFFFFCFFHFLFFLFLSFISWKTAFLINFVLFSFALSYMWKSSRRKTAKIYRTPLFQYFATDHL